jgi:hypothetical protein
MRDQMKNMNGSRLTNSIDSPDSLLEPHRVPGQFKIDDDAARLLKIEAFTSRVGRKEESAISAREAFDGGEPFVTVHAPVQQNGGPPNGRLNVQERVPVLGEDNDRLTHSAKKATEGGDLRLVLRRFTRSNGKCAEEPALTPLILEAKQRRPLRSIVGRRQLAGCIAQRQLDLPLGLFVRQGQGGETTLNRTLKRACA